jgi:hypothetical protein
MTEEELLVFAAASFRSVWTLELLLLLKRNREQSWRADDLVRELRSSDVVVSEGLTNLMNAGLVVESETGVYRYQATSPHVEEIVNDLERMYAAKPTSVIRAIVTAPSEKLRILSDAFKLKE